MEIHQLNVRNRGTIKIRYSSLLFVVIMIPFVEPRIFNEAEFWINLHVHDIYEVARYLAFAAIIFYNLLHLNVKYSPVTQMIIVYFSLMVVSTIVNHGALRASVTYFFTTCGVCIFADLFIHKYGVMQYCRNMARFLLVLVVINCITIWLFPGGLYAGTLIDLYRAQNWFLGYKNSHIYVYLPCLFFVFIIGVQQRRKIKWGDVVLALVVLISIIISDSTTSLVVMLCFCVYLVLNFRTNHRWLENPFLQYVLVLLVNYALIFVNIVQLLQDYISAIFDKYSTVESRTVIWNNALRFIRESPLLGNGIEDYDVSLMKIYGQAHNKLLDVAYVGGIVGLVSFALILLYVIIQLNKNRKTKETKICTIVFLCYNIVFLTEAQRDNPLYFVVLVTIYYICNRRLKDSADISMSKA